MKDYYQILGVDRAASPDAIKRAYRRLASQHHPDKGGDTARFQEIEEAYRILSDPGLRSQYDSPRPQSAWQQPPGSFNFDDIFQMFGARFTQQAPRQSARIQLWITLRDVVQAGRKIIAVNSPRGSTNIEIDLPPGTSDGDTVRYPGVAPGGLDLVVTFRIQPDPAWQRNGNDVVHEILVSIWDLILGSNVTVTTLSDNTISVTIPPNTQPGTMLRCKGHGLRSRMQHTPGDLFIKLQARIPNVISNQLKEHIRQERNQ